MNTWLPIFDVADAWPSDPAACWADGYRVVAGYAGSQNWKAMSPARVALWRGIGMAIAPMFESAGDEAYADPSDGTAHGRAARAGWRALGCPDSAAIAYAVDRDVSMAQVMGPIAKYFELVGKADTALPIAYLENDGVEWLAARGLIAGGFIPAAFAWGNPPTLATPTNAPAHALWLQEHNGRSLHGGTVDIGHILASAPIWWSDDMGMTKDDATVLWETDGLVKNYDWHPDATSNPGIRPDSLVRGAGDEAHAAHVAAVAALAQATAAVTAVAALAAKVSAIPTTAASSGPMTDADVARIAAATVDLLAKREAS